MRSWYAVLASLLAVLILSAPALADGQGEVRDAGHGADCKSDGAWVSRNFALTPTLRRGCVLAPPGSNQKLRVEHLRRGGSTGADFSVDPLALTPAPVSQPAAVDETQSHLELTGSWNRWSYEWKFVLGRAERLVGGRLEPEDRSELRLKSTFDLGIVRPGVEVREAIAEERPQIERDFAMRGDSRTLAGGRAFVDIVLPSAPVLILAVGREQLDSFRDLMPEQPDLLRDHTSAHDRTDAEFATGALWYQRETWQALASTSVYEFRNPTRPGSPESTLYYHYLSGSYWPVPTLTINPILHYSDASYDGGGTAIRTVGANLGIYSTAVGHSGLLTLWSGYTRSHDTPKSFDYEQFDLAVGAERAISDVASFGGYGISVGGSVGYSHYVDRVNPDNTGPGYRALLTLRIAAAPQCAGREAAMTRSCSLRPGS